MTLIAQHQEEEQFARVLFGALGLGPVQALERGKPAPDFIVRLPGRTIALEITELFHPSNEVIPRQGTENYRARLLKTAGSEWRSRGCPAVEAHVFFDVSATISKNRIAGLACQLCDAVQHALPAAGNSAFLEFDWEQEDTYLAEQIIAVHVLRLPEGSRSHWLSPDFGHPRPLDAAMLQAVMDRKSQADYKEPGAEPWLLLVVDGRRISASFEFTADVTQCEYRSPFDRIFVLDMYSGHVVELNAA
jgi:hypothetical protein